MSWIFCTFIYLHLQHQLLQISSSSSIYFICLLPIAIFLKSLCYIPKRGLFFLLLLFLSTLSVYSFLCFMPFIHLFTISYTVFPSLRLFSIVFLFWASTLWFTQMTTCLELKEISISTTLPFLILQSTLELHDELSPYQITYCKYF